jgi:predicted nucleotidyltransferase
VATLEQARLDRTERRAIDRFVDLLEERFGEDLDGVWLYGSRARGEDTGPESDVDLLVLTTGGHERDFATVHGLMADAAVEVGARPPYFSVRVGNREWLAGRREIDAFFIQEVDRDRIVLRGQP